MDYQGKSSPLWDCRYAAETPKPTVAIAIQLYHPAFAFFSSKAFDPGFEVPPELESQTYNLLVKSAAIYRSEEERRLKIKPILGKIIGRSLLAVRNDDFTAPDGSVMGSHPGPASYILVNEGKKEIGDGGSDPSTQAAFSFLRRYQQEEAQDIAQRCCCPTFLVAQAGPWFAILGGVITSQCIVQRLTDFLWLPFHSSHDEDQCTRIARILYALRESLSQLDDWYKTIARLSPIDIGVPHPRFFPSPDHFEHDGKLVKFTYEKPFDPDPSCKTYLATANKTKVVVKFVTDYGADVHRAMEDEGFAPKLLYCGPVKVIPAMPGYGKLKMVVMDYVAGNTLADVLKSEEGCAARNSPIERLGALRNIIKSLHAKHFVYGDLRSPNIMITTEGKVQLIDFDWAGKHGEARYPLSISPCVEWPNGVSGGGYIQPEHDNAMLDLLF
ncbi:uncharacterized protein EI90DRAFT_3173059 [Cantharellus anzutake]|uniref:uncharacterized protein n=1 Tax=Cantharellus anzutake TaxID=1750568 RepID=UPI001904EFCF|nr:uncharacterized protein EI90DRAFT_3173059 [Cantharellus anzutake]KAF8316230.1 hypothetical protein EI90DRAFT_3173059 [Cantharellus anzutake]